MKRLLFLCMATACMAFREDVMDEVSMNFYECPVIEVMENFDKEKFLSGGWYEIGHYRENLADNRLETKSCMYSEFKNGEGNWYMPVGLTAPQNMKRESVFVNAEGVLDCAVDILTPKYDTSGVLRLYASYLYPSSYEGMNVVATNYEDYAVLHECAAGGVERVQVLSRRPTMQNALLDFIQRALEFKGSDFSGRFVRTDNFGQCPYRNTKKNNSNDKKIEVEVGEFSDENDEPKPRKTIFWW